MNKINDLLNKIKTKIKKNFCFLDKNRKFNLMEVVALLIITSVFGMFAGGVLMYQKGTLNYGIKKELREFMNMYAEILNEYYTDIKEDGLLESGVKGMISYLGDPYSVYMDEPTSIAFNEKINGEYVGIGIEIIQYIDYTVEVKDSYENGPAYIAGIRKGDILKKVDDKDVTKMNLVDISNLVKGKEGTKVKITVLRNDRELDFMITRGSVDIKSIESDMLSYQDNKIGYIKIDIFAANTSEQFEEELKKMEEEGLDSLIIDVRNNSGGYLSSVSKILSLFLEKGDLIYQMKTKDKIEKVYDKTSESRNYKIAVLVNGVSASASELLTASIMETYNGYIVGTKTFGKSKVQKTQELSNGGMIKFTYQEWLTPNGNNIGDIGITPQYEVEYEFNENMNFDSQIQKALELLTQSE